VRLYLCGDWNADRAAWHKRSVDAPKKSFGEIIYPAGAGQLMDANAVSRECQPVNWDVGGKPAHSGNGLITTNAGLCWAFQAAHDSAFGLRTDAPCHTLEVGSAAFPFSPVPMHAMQPRSGAEAYTPLQANG
jgi:hypothetical protein